jgi:hypothetical protein
MLFQKSCLSRHAFDGCYYRTIVDVAMQQFDTLAKSQRANLLR